eukprot:gene12969-7628_t
MKELIDNLGENFWLQKSYGFNTSLQSLIKKEIQIDKAILDKAKELTNEIGDNQILWRSLQQEMFLRELRTVSNPLKRTLEELKTLETTEISQVRLLFSLTLEAKKSFTSSTIIKKRKKKNNEEALLEEKQSEK